MKLDFYQGKAAYTLLRREINKMNKIETGWKIYKDATCHIEYIL